MIKYTCCFTGHRSLQPEKRERINSRLSDEIERLINKGVKYFISGGALGFDQMAAAIIIEKKEKGYPIKLVFALPCPEFDERWNDKQKQYMQSLMSKADCIQYISQTYSYNCLKKRNQFMVNSSDVCICAMMHNRTGTAQTVSMARKRGIEIINILANQI